MLSYKILKEIMHWEMQLFLLFSVCVYFYTYVNKYLCAIKGAFSFFSIRGRKAGGSFKADSLMKQNQEWNKKTGKSGEKQTQKLEEKK